MKRVRPPAAPARSLVQPDDDLFATLDPAMLAAELLPRLSTRALAALGRTCRRMHALAYPAVCAHQQRELDAFLLRAQMTVLRQWVAPYILDDTMRMRFAVETLYRSSFRPILVEYNHSSGAAAADAGDHAARPPCQVAFPGGPEGAAATADPVARLFATTFAASRRPRLAIPWPASLIADDAAPPLTWVQPELTVWRVLLDHVRSQNKTRIPVFSGLVHLAPRLNAAALLEDLPPAHAAGGARVLGPLIHFVPLPAAAAAPPQLALVVTSRPSTRRDTELLGGLQQLTYVEFIVNLHNGHMEHTGNILMQKNAIARYVARAQAQTFDAAPPGAFLPLPPAIAAIHQTTHALWRSS